jgi:FMN-dependent oxidoreductase (nitrilotriacetate monooxygenase family)
VTRTEKLAIGIIVEPFGMCWNGWTHPGTDPDANVSLDAVGAIVAKAEEGLFAFAFFADTPAAHVDDRPYYLSRFEPVTAISALAARTSRIGLVATVSTSLSEPYTVARQVASVDNLSRGRAGWNVVTSPHDIAFANYGRRTMMDHADRYAQASEFLDVARGLWNSYDDGAFVKDVASRTYLDRTKVRVLDHKGEHFQVRGPLNVQRSAQGHPVVFQAGSSEVGRDVAAKYADATFAVQSELEPAREYYQDIKRRAVGFGRSAEEIRVFMGISPLIGRDAEEVARKRELISAYASDTEALAALSYLYNRYDFGEHDLDGPFPDMSALGSTTYRSVTADLQAQADREGLTLRQTAHLAAAPNADLFGTPEQIADHLQLWFESEAADGFLLNNWLEPSGVEDFVDLVVPLLQERGIYPREYPGTTLRDSLGLPVPGRVGEA